MALFMTFKIPNRHQTEARLAMDYPIGLIFGELFAPVFFIEARTFGRISDTLN